jgi:hypothetical protein
MTYKTVTTTASVDVDVDVDIDLDQWDDEELIDEMNQRGYTCIKDREAGMDREDWQFLLDQLDKNPETWYTRRVRDKLMGARHG